MVVEKKVLFIASAGGHLNEILQLRPLFNKCDAFIMTEKTGASGDLIKEMPGKTAYLLYGTTSHPLSYPFKLLGNCFISLYYYLKFKPDCIVTTGVQSAGPMCCIGKIFGSRIIYIETFANIITKSATGSIVYHFADDFVVQWESMKELYPKAIYGGPIF